MGVYNVLLNNHQNEIDLYGLIFYLIDTFLGIRVNEQEEIVGLDISEHDMEAYAGFQIFTVE